MSRSMLVRAAAAALLLRCGAHAQAPAKEACPLHVPGAAFSSNVAWTAMFNAQPHHVMAPFKADLSPPVSIDGLCAANLFSSSAFEFSGLVGGEWIAKPTGNTSLSVKFGRAEGPCQQGLDGLSVTTATVPTLRLHFAGCGAPAAVLALRLTNSTQPKADFLPAEGVELVDFMCQISPRDCDSVRLKLKKASRAGGETKESPRDDELGEVGVGRCTGEGVKPEVVAGVASTGACAATCTGRIAANLKDPDQPSCRGYAWSEKLKSCRVYDLWPITGTDGSSAEGYYCYKVTDALSTPAPVTTQPMTVEKTPRQEVLLSLSKLFEASPRAITARRMHVVPFTKGCFETFDWFILDRSVYVPPHDLQLLMEMTRVNAKEFVLKAPQEGGSAPRCDLTVERVCVKDCGGALRAECAEPGEGAAPLLASEGPSPCCMAQTAACVACARGTTPAQLCAEPGRETLVGCEAYAPTSTSTTTAAPALLPQGGGALQPAGGHNVTCESFPCTVIGDAAFEAFTDVDFWPWALAFGVVAMLLGCCSGGCVARCFRKNHPPAYQTVEAVKLVYDGEEEEELILQSTADGAMMSVMGSGNAMASFKPSKASPKMAGRQNHFATC